MADMQTRDGTADEDHSYGLNDFGPNSYGSYADEGRHRGRGSSGGLLRDRGTVQADVPQAGSLSLAQVPQIQRTVPTRAAQVLRILINAS